MSILRFCFALLQFFANPIRVAPRTVAVPGLLRTRISDLPLTQRPLQQEIVLEADPSGKSEVVGSKKEKLRSELAKMGLETD
jgi:hypothetical protein